MKNKAKEIICGSKNDLQRLADRIQGSQTTAQRDTCTRQCKDLDARLERVDSILQSLVEEQKKAATMLEQHRTRATDGQPVVGRMVDDALGAKDEQVPFGQRVDDALGAKDEQVPFGQRVDDRSSPAIASLFNKLESAEAMVAAMDADVAAVNGERNEMEAQLKKAKQKLEEAQARDANDATFLGLIRLIDKGTNVTQAANDLMALTRDSNIIIRMSDSLKPLVALFESGEESRKEYAAGALRNLAFETANRAAIVEAGGIRPLVALTTGTEKQKEYAAGALWFIAADNDANQEAIMEAGGIKPLVELVKSGTNEQKKIAAGALMSLARNNSKAHVLIRVAGGIAPLVALVTSGTAGQKEYTAMALASLAVSIRNQNAIVAAGGIKPLVALVGSGTEGQSKYAAAALANLARGNAVTQAAIAAAGGIAPLVKLVTSGTNGQKEEAAYALTNLSDKEENRAAIANAGGIAPLIALVRSGTEKHKEYAAKTLKNIAFGEDIARMIADAGGIVPLLALVSRSGTKEQGERHAPADRDRARAGDYAAQVLWLLSFDADIARRIADADGIALLSALATSGPEGQKEYAEQALANIRIMEAEQELTNQRKELN